MLDKTDIRGQIRFCFIHELIKRERKLAYESYEIAPSRRRHSLQPMQLSGVAPYIISTYSVILAPGQYYFTA